jgi:DNA-binding winged helix-turn-helix (wHTH) protein
MAAEQWSPSALARREGVTGALGGSYGAIMPGQDNVVRRQLRFGPFHVDLANERLFHGSRPLSLKPRAFALLLYLAERPQRLVTKRELLKVIWSDAHVGEAALKTQIKDIRRVLEDSVKQPRFIETVNRRGYRFIAPVEGRLSHSVTAKLPWLDGLSTSGRVDRRVQLAELSDALQRALGSSRQLVFLTGEAGSGKSALLDAFIAQVGARADITVARGQAVEHDRGAAAYAPFLEALGRLCRSPGAHAIASGLARRAPSWFQLLPGIGDLASTARREQREHQRSARPSESMSREFAEWLGLTTLEKPLLLCLEDLQWADAATLDLVSYLAVREGLGAVLLVASYRPGDHVIACLDRVFNHCGRSSAIRLPPLGVDGLAEIQ